VSEISVSEMDLGLSRDKYWKQRNRSAGDGLQDPREAKILAVAGAVKLIDKCVEIGVEPTACW
jgi:hypothetical protein